MQPRSFLNPLRNLAIGSGAIAWACAALSGAPCAAEPVTVAVIDFDYVDPSGGIIEQERVQAERLRTLVEQLRQGLDQSDRYQVVALTCDPSPCSAGRTDPAELLAKARAVGARLLVYGGVQKMNAAVQYGNAEAVDLLADRLVFDRNVVLRNDSQEAWDYAAKYLVSELVNQKLVQTETITQ
jgi:hypothetical protein